jgi:hypothetical protein
MRDPRLGLRRQGLISVTVIPGRCDSIEPRPRRRSHTAKQTLLRPTRGLQLMPITPVSPMVRDLLLSSGKNMNGCRIRSLAIALAISVGMVSMLSAAASAAQPLPPNVGPLMHFVATVARSCDSAAYSLWASNEYSRYRQRKASPLSIHYNADRIGAVPDIPAELSEPLRAELVASIDRATQVLRMSAQTFKDLADYVAAKDFEGDHYKKGDELNAQLIELGQKCFAAAKELRAEHRKMAQFILQNFDIIDPMVKRMGEDWASALVLADELAKGPKADLGKVGSLVDQLTALDETRKREIGEAAGNGPRISRFYNIELDRALVNLRRFLRESKGQPALMEAQMADRPRTAFSFGQELLDMEMSESIFYALY